jgi:hypothetical protein
MRSQGVSRKIAEKQMADTLKFITRTGVVKRLDEKTGGYVDLELDGYHEWLRSAKAPHGVAIEYQGRMHYENCTGDKPERWLRQRANDKIKVEELAKMNIPLIKIHYKIPDGAMGDYVKSRFYDLGVLKRCHYEPTLDFQYIKESDYPEPEVKGPESTIKKVRVGRRGRIPIRS